MTFQPVNPGDLITANLWNNTVSQIENIAANTIDTIVALQTLDVTQVANAASNAALAAVEAMIPSVPVQSVAGRTGNIVLNSSDVTTALGFTPVNNAALSAVEAMIPSVPVQSVAGRTGNIILNSSDVTTALGFTPVNNAVVGAASGVATLDSSGRLTNAQIPSGIVGAIVYQGTWDAFRNSPTLTSSVGTKGYLYKVNNAGTTSINGISTWNVGDDIVFDGTAWDKIDGLQSEVVSVSGRTGAITLSVSDISGAAPLVSPALTGNPTAPTPVSSDNSTNVATTAYVKEQGYLTSVTSVANATYANSAGSASTATFANSANSASTATFANSASTATFATTAGSISGGGTAGVTTLTVSNTVNFGGNTVNVGYGPNYFNWNYAALPPPAANDSYYFMAFGNNIFYAVSPYGNTAISTNAQTWTTASNLAGNPSTIYAYNLPTVYNANSNTFLTITSVTSSGYCGYSVANGTTGAFIANGVFNSVPNITSPVKAFAGGGHFYVLDSANYTINYSSNGITWNTVYSPISIAYTPLMAYGNGICVISGGGPIAYSTTPGTWTPLNYAFGGQYATALAYGNGIFVSVAGYYAFYSSNVATWTQVTLPTYSNVLYFAGNLFFAFYNGSSSYSTNGASWSTSTFPTTTVPSSIFYSNGMYVASSYLNTYTSVDGINWTLSAVLGSSPNLVYGNNVIAGITGIGSGSSGNTAVSYSWNSDYGIQNSGYLTYSCVNYNGSGGSGYYSAPLVSHIFITSNVSHIYLPVVSLPGVRIRFTFNGVQITNGVGPNITFQSVSQTVYGGSVTMTSSPVCSVEFAMDTNNAWWRVQ